MTASTEYPLDPNLTSRLATEADIDAIVDVTIHAFLDDPAWRYLNHNEETVFRFKEQFAHELQIPIKYIVLVVTAEDHGEAKGTGRVCATATWDTDRGFFDGEAPGVSETSIDVTSRTQQAASR